MSSLTVEQPGKQFLTGFQYFWMMDVRGFNPATHCMSCLVGDRVEAVKHKFPIGKTLQLHTLEPGHIYYLCGVSDNYLWQNNFHVTFTDGKWDIEAEMYNGAKVILRGVQPVHFDGEAAKRDYPHLGKKFLTCRNFQFGAEHFPVADKMFGDTGGGPKFK